MDFAKPMASLFVVLVTLIFVGTATAASGQVAPIGASLAHQDSWGLGVLSWSEVVPITDDTGRSFDSTAQFYSPSVHFVRRRNRARDGFLYEAYALYGKVDIQAEGGLTYFQKRVTAYGMGGAVGWYFRPESKQVYIGFSAPIQYRHVDWTQPEGGSVSKKDTAAIGASLDFRWRWTADIGINQRVGTLLGYRGALWMVQLEWTL